MKNGIKQLLLFISIMLFTSTACAISENLPFSSPPPTLTPTLIPTQLPANPIKPGANAPDEPVFVIGDIPYTSPFFLNTASEPFVMLEDQAGFILRDREFQFSIVHQRETMWRSRGFPPRSSDHAHSPAP